MRLNPHQLEIRRRKREALDNGRLLRTILVKFRQFGGTTNEVAEADYLAGTNIGQYAVTIAHDLATTIKIFEIVRRFYESVASPENCYPNNGRPRHVPMYHWKRARSNKREHYYPEADSRHFIGTAGNVAFGHGLTIQKAHLSEAARFPNLKESLAALEGVPSTGELTMESTPFGATGTFYDLAQEAFLGQNEYTLIFFTWMSFIEYQLPCSRDEEQQILWEVVRGSHPQFGNEERALFERLKAEGQPGLTAGQWKWRRWKRASLKDKFFEQYPEDWVTCWLASGRPVFDLIALAGMPTVEPIRKADGDVSWVYEEAVRGREYIAWCDPAEGIEREGVDELEGGTDLTAWGITDTITGEDCVVGVGRVGVAETARLIDRWGREYNNALAVVERNNHGHAVLLSLMDIQSYPNLYHHVEALKPGDEPELRPGWPTMKTNRSMMIDALDTAMREGFYVPRDTRMRQQMQTFIYDSKGKATAAHGSHDDLVTGRAMCEAVRQIPSGATIDPGFL